MPKIGLIPLDSRPCNYNWLKRLCKAQDISLCILPLNECGKMHEGANPTYVRNFLKENFDKADDWIISLDASIFGGLIQARKGSGLKEDAVLFFELLKELKQQYPSKHIYVFDTIMRTSISALSKEDEKYWKLVNEYSKYYGLVHFFSDKEYVEKLNQITSLIPRRVLSTYQDARKMKHGVNMMSLLNVRKKVIDELIILQEDSMPYGLQKVEQQEILEYIKNYNLENVSIYNGTDEGALIFLSKILLQESKQKDVYLYVPCEKLLNRVHLFEDHIFMENLYSMAKTIGLNLERKNLNQSVALCIYGEEENTDLDLSEYKEMPLDQAILDEFINGFNNINMKKVLVDLKFPNGGSIELLRKIDASSLDGYAAWNTSSNSIGLGLFFVVVALLNKTNNLVKNFINERIIDDALYQSNVREKINEILLKSGVNIFDLDIPNQKVIEEIKKHLDPLTKEFNINNYKISLPWNRTFECDVEIINEEGENNV